MDMTKEAVGLKLMTVGDLVKKNYLTYAVSVIMDRALPDVRDGLKPVHRRILYSMYKLKIMPGSSYVKSARVVGEVMGKYHPHGDSAIYDAAVYMAQPWSKRVTLIDGQGNFGSVDGDNPAAIRYTEMRMTKAGAAFFNDLDKEAVDFVDNYDGKETEPVVLPVSYPNIWVNGAEGIAVGMATYIPPHNLNETVDLALAFQENRDLPLEEILRIMPGPDFPTGGIVHDLDGFRDAVLTGRGTIRVRSRWHHEDVDGGRSLLILDELPFKVNKKELIEDIAEKARVKGSDLDDVADIHDESNKDGIRVVITLKKGAIPAVVFNRLLKRTRVGESYSYNAMLLEGKSPRQMGLREIMLRFLDFREEVVRKRIAFDLKKANDRLHILNGFMAALADVQRAVKIVMDNRDGNSANEALCEEFGLDKTQAQAILDMRLQRLTGMEIDAIKTERNETSLRVEDMEDSLSKPSRIREMVKRDLLVAKEAFGSERKSEISYESSKLDMSDLVKKEPCLIHLTKNGYLKRMPLSGMEQQRRSGKGRSGMQTGDGDYVEAVYSGSTHDLFLTFTTSGRVWSSRVWNLPDGTMSQRGRHLRNVFEALDEAVAGIAIVPELASGKSLITVSAKGKTKRTSLTAYSGAFRRNGVKGVGVEDGDRLVAALIAEEGDHLVLVSSQGRAARFEIGGGALQERGRGSVGVIGMRVPDGEEIVSAAILKKGETGRHLICVGENGIGKKTPIDEFSPHARGSKGVGCFGMNERTGRIAMAALASDGEDLVLASASKAIRLKVEDVRSSGRRTAGTILMNVGSERVIDAIVVPRSEDEDDGMEADLENENGEIADGDGDE